MIIAVAQKSDPLSVQWSQALRERHQHPFEFPTRDMIDALPAAVYITDAAGKITYFNTACIEFSGRVPQLGTDHWCVTWKLFYPDGRPMPHDECPMAIALKEGRAIRGAEAIAERPDGTRVCFMPYPTPLRDEHGTIVGGINMLVDITERKAAEQARARLAAIVDSSDDAIVSKDLNSVVNSWNAGAERLFGYTAEEVIGQPITMLMPPDRVNEEADILARIRRGERVHHYETVRRRKDGMLLDVSLSVSPVIDSRGEIIGASKIARGISERIKAEQALRASEQRYRQTLALMPAAVYCCDAAGVITFYNDQAVLHWGRVPQVGDTDERFCGSEQMILPDGTPLPHDQCPMAVALREGRSFRDQEVSIRRPDGSLIAVLVNIDPLLDSQGNVIGAINAFHDVTALKQAEHALQHHRDNLEKTVKERTEEVTRAERALATAQRMAAVGTLAAGLAHDMTNLLFPLGIRLEALLKCHRVEPAVHTELVVISALLDHLRDLSRNLSLFARDPEKEGIVGRTNIAQWHSSVHKLLDASVGREIVVKWDCPPAGITVPDAAIAPHRLTQAVQNLIHNARDAVLAAKARDPQRMPRISIEARPAEDASFILLKVGDNGIGMDEQTMKHCIEPFFTTHDRPNEPVQSGSGLGLSLAHQIVERAGGSMHIESTPGMGTTVLLKLPAAAL